MQASARAVMDKVKRLERGVVESEREE